MGITTAYFLAKSGRCAHITILEEGDPAGGASGKAAGFLARDWHGPPTSVGVGKGYWGLGDWRLTCYQVEMRRAHSHLSTPQ